MEREIYVTKKRKAKRKDNNEWVTGYYVCLNENCHHSRRIAEKIVQLLKEDERNHRELNPIDWSDTK